MKILNLLFNAINPDKKNTWLSCKYHQWLYLRLEKQAKKHREHIKDRAMFFEVVGAGDILMSKSCHFATGEAVGFDFGVEWGNTGFIGGVIGRSEAKRMANFILKTCSEVTETEQQEKKRMGFERAKLIDDFYKNHDQKM